MRIQQIYKEQNGEQFIRKNDSIVGLYFHNIVGLPLIRLMQKLKLHFSPNVITIVTLIFGLIAGYCFFMGQLIYGMVFFVLNMISDTLDGKWARLTNQKTKLGEKLDQTSDRISKASWYVGIWYSQYYGHEYWWIGICLIVAHYMTEIFREKIIKTDIFLYIKYLYYSPFEDAYVTFFIAPLFTLLFRIPHYYTFSFAVLLLILSYARYQYFVRKNV